MTHNLWRNDGGENNAINVAVIVKVWTVHYYNTDSEIQHVDPGLTHLRFAWAGLPSYRASSLCSLLKLSYYHHLKIY